MNIHRVLKQGMKLQYYGILLLFFTVSGQTLHAQEVAPAIKFDAQKYICYQRSSVLAIDGRLDDPAWTKARWTNNFVDITGNNTKKLRYKTRVKMLWDETYLYIAAELEESQLWATLTKRDAVIFHDNNFEIFLDPDGDTHHYYEMEINAYGTIWDLMLTKPYRDGGQPIDAWNMRGLKSGIDIKGTLNNPADTDTGWTVELAVPWKAIEASPHSGKHPKIGDQWRINFSRVEWKLSSKNGNYQKSINPDTQKPYSEDNWVWSPQGVVNMHYPEMWGFVKFAGEKDASNKTFKLGDEQHIKWYLRRLYYREHQYKKKNGSFTSNLKALGARNIFQEVLLREQDSTLSLPEVHATHNTFELRMRDVKNNNVWVIGEAGRIWSSSLSSQ